MTEPRFLQTEFFDVASRGPSFDYDAYLADIASRPLPSTRRRMTPRDETDNPLYGQGKPKPYFLTLSATFSRTAYKYLP